MSKRQEKAAATQCLLSAGRWSLNLVLWLVSGIEARIPAAPVKNFTSRRQRFGSSRSGGGRENFESELPVFRL
jgi:hypothetical protein